MTTTTQDESLTPFDVEWVVNVVLCDMDVPAVSEEAAIALSQVGYIDRYTALCLIFTTTSP